MKKIHKKRNIQKKKSRKRKNKSKIKKKQLNNSTADKEIIELQNINLNDNLYDIEEHEIKEIEKYITNGYFDFNVDILDFYENNIINSDNISFEDNVPIINKEFYLNIPLEYINNVKYLIKSINNLKNNEINYDFIKEKDLPDKNFKNYENNLDNISEHEIDYLQNEYLDLVSDNNNSNKENHDKKTIKEDKKKYDINSKEEENSSSNDNLEEKLLIDDTFIDYEKKYSSNKKLWWPVKVKYGGKSYYVANNNIYLNNANCNKLSYFCVNHRINTIKKKLLFGKNPCNGKLEFNRTTLKFYFIKKHNDICDEKNIKIYDNNTDVNNSINDYNDYKAELLNFLNHNPLTSYYCFRQYALKLLIKSNFKFEIKDTTLSNIYYPWHSNSKIFSWVSIFDNSKTISNEVFLRDVQIKFCYNPKENNYYWHKHAVWISPLFIKILQTTEHMYIDAIFITTKDFFQLLIIMAYDKILNLKFPCCYILMNTKNEYSYELVLASLYNIITYDGKVKLNVISITTDFECALMNAIKKIFIKTRIIGCLFHFAKCIRLNLLKIGLYNESVRDITDNLLKGITSLPFKYQDNLNIIDETFKRFETYYKKDYKNLFFRFKNYFLNTWSNYFKEGILNYKFINKIQRSNSYLENYNRRIRDILGPFLSKRGRSIIPWPLFLTFIINEEQFFSIKIKTNLTNELKNIDRLELKKVIIKEKNIITFDNKTINDIYWLQYNDFSCRYDAFTFLYFSTIYPILRNNSNNIINNNILNLNKLLEEIIKNIKIKKNVNIWDICHNNKNYSLDILNINNWYKQKFHIYHLFDWFKGDQMFSIKYTNFKFCNLCCKSESKDLYFEPIIPITLDIIQKFKSLKDILYNKFSITKNACIFCSYNTDKTLKNEEKYKYCVSNIINNVILSKFLLFGFELSGPNENENIQFSNINKFNEEIKDLILDYFDFNNTKYRLLGIIFMKNVDHYTSYCHFSNTNELNLNIGNSYYYDDLNNGKIELINGNDFNCKLNKIIPNNPFIILYGNI